MGGIAIQHYMLVTHFLLPPLPPVAERELVSFLFLALLFLFLLPFVLFSEAESVQTSFPPRLLRPATGKQGRSRTEQATDWGGPGS